VTRADVDVLLIGAAWAGGVALTGAVLVRAVRGRSMRTALVSVAVICVLSVVAGIAGTAQAMFLSAHDLGVVLPVSLVAGAVGLAVALVLGAAAVRDVERVRAQARALGGSDGDTGGTSSTAGQAGGSALSRRRRGAAVRELGEIEAELTRAAARLTEARRREQALESSRRELIAWVSHDLRTPLAGLRAMAEALEDGVATDPQRYHRQIRREVDRLAGMVDDLFELSRIQAGALTLSLQAVDLSELVDDVVAGSLPMAEAGGVHLGALALAAPARVRGDAAELARVLANLVVNAIRHTPSDGSVHISGTADGATCVLSVSDGCGGLAPEELERVFDAGWRGSAARTPAQDGGAGLGLAIARGIVEAHQGRILVRNTGTGCRFEVHLPAEPVPS
jgi:signal transduction histidine kinase